VYAAAYAILKDPVRAQDVVQDVFLSHWRRRDAYDPARGSLGSYLKLKARSRALDLWREGEVATRATERLRVLARDDTIRVDERPAAASERRQLRRMVQRALMRLPDSQREAIVMAYWGELTADQIAERLDAPLGTVKSRIRLGLIRLRDECARQDDELARAA
jgi:RNA polymerase sigma-70 factor (ECF subfamily)